MTIGHSSQPFHRIANRYRLVNRIISFGLDAVWRRQAIAELDLNEGMVVLDLGSGPGEMLELAPEQVTKLGLDPVREMLYCSSSIFKKIVGYGENIPIKDASVNRIMSAFVLRNLSDRSSTFSELNRILKPGGRGVVMDFSPPERTIWGGMAYAFIKYGIPGLGGLISGDFPAYRYLSRTILAFPKPEVIAEELKTAGFSSVRYRRLIGGVNVLYSFRKVDG